jgi:hypothetical protein
MQRVNRLRPLKIAVSLCLVRQGVRSMLRLAPMAKALPSLE